MSHQTLLVLFGRFINEILAAIILMSIGFIAFLAVYMRYKKENNSGIKL